MTDSFDEDFDKTTDVLFAICAAVLVLNPIIFFILEVMK